MRRIKIDVDKIKRLYWQRKYSIRKIAKKLGFSMGAIRNEMLRQGISRRPTTKRDVIKPSKDEIKKLYITKKFTLDKTAKILGIATSTVFRWMKDYKIPTRKYKYQKYNFSENLKEKAYILGLVAGDIHVRKHSRQILAELTTTHPAMINLFYSTFQKYGAPQKYLKYNNKTKRYEWKVYVLLNDSFSFMLQNIFNIDNEYFYDFLAGFFDCEGCLFIYDNHEFIGLSALIYNSNKELLNIIKKRLEIDDFHPKISKYFNKNTKTTNGYYRKKDLWAIRMHTNQEVISLIKRMPLRHREKIAKFEIVKSTNSNKWKAISDKVINLRNNIREEVKQCLLSK